MKLYAKNVFLALTQLLNALLGGDPDESFSSRCGKKHPAVARVIDRLFFWEPRHCAASVEPDEGARTLTRSDWYQVVGVAVAILILIILLT